MPLLTRVQAFDNGDWVDEVSLAVLADDVGVEVTQLGVQLLLLSGGTVLGGTHLGTGGLIGSHCRSLEGKQ